MALFVVLSVLWLVAAATAQVWDHSVSNGYVWPSRSASYPWIGIGIAGTVFLLGWLLHRLWRVHQHEVLVILACCIGGAAEWLMVLVVTRHAIETALHGAYSGEGVVAIAPLVVTYDDAPAEALCHGWIDGQLGAGDDGTYRRRFTPRRPRSAWSKRNVAIATKLVEEGRMRPPGLAAVSRAKADGTWHTAYEGQATIEIPADLAAALAADPVASAMFDKLNASNRYAILYRVTTAKQADTRRRRIEQFVGMLARGEAIHPQQEFTPRRKPD
jgi:uncharacterized protein YdeI (YjbR/CyaY-like superfamily)